MIDDCKDFMEAVKIAESLIDDDSIFQIYILIASWKYRDITRYNDFKCMQQSLQRPMSFMTFDRIGRTIWLDNVTYKYKDKSIYTNTSFVYRETPQILINYR